MVDEISRPDSAGRRAARLERQIATRQVSPADVLVAGQLKRMRAASGLPLREVAGALGVSKEMVSRYERAEDRLPARFLPKVASLLGVTLDDFLPAVPGRFDSTAADKMKSLDAFMKLVDTIESTRALWLLRQLAEELASNRKPSPRSRKPGANTDPSHQDDLADASATPL